MIGSVEFNDPCYYRYASLDIEQLRANLGEDAGLVKQAVDAYIRAFAFAIPTGKQNSFAAHNPPSFIMVAARNGMPWNLANAFVNPISSRNGGVIQNSVDALLHYWDELCLVYGDQDPVATPWLSAGISATGEFSLTGHKVADFNTLVDRIVEAL
jgi:CRISPR system Cascade subunit CasC